MKLLLSLFVFMASQAYAAPLRVTIENESSNSTVSLGLFKSRFSIPSLCEDGPCWEPVGQRFKKIAPDADAGETKVFTLNKESLTKESHFIRIEGDGQSRDIEITSCDLLSREAAVHYAPLAGVVELNSLDRSSICLMNTTLTLRLR